jgi:hypothetical protein
VRKEALPRPSPNSSLLKQEGIKEFLNWYHKDFSREKEIELANERQISLQEGQLAWSQSPAAEPFSKREARVEEAYVPHPDLPKCPHACHPVGTHAVGAGTNMI